MRCQSKADFRLLGRTEADSAYLQTSISPSTPTLSLHGLHSLLALSTQISPSFLSTAYYRCRPTDRPTACVQCQPAHQPSSLIFSLANQTATTWPTPDSQHLHRCLLPPCYHRQRLRAVVTTASSPAHTIFIALVATRAPDAAPRARSPAGRKP